MQPQDTNTSPNPDFDFLLKEQQSQKSSSRLSNLSVPAKIFIAGLVVLIVILVAAVFLNRGNSNAELVVDLMAQSQEIVRVSQLQDLQFQDSNTRALAATATAALQSHQSQIGDHLKKAGVKISENQLALQTNNDTDTRLQTAAQNNNLDGTYTDYLKKSLSAYQASLTEAFQATQSTALKQTLQTAYESVAILLNSPQFKS